MNGSKKVSRPGFQLRELSLYLAFFIPLSAAALYFFYWLSDQSAVLGIAGYVLVLIAGLGMMVAPKMWEAKIAGIEDDPEAVALYVIGGALFFVVGFSQLARQFALAAGGFEAAGDSYWHWLRYGIANFLESALLDVPAIYEWNISEIRATSFWSRGLVFSFRTFMEFYVIASMIQSIRIARATAKAEPQNANVTYSKYLLNATGHMIALMAWGIPLTLGLFAIFNEGISFQDAISTLLNILPLIAGAWLGWNSLLALASLKGDGNKLLAGLGVCAGIWLIERNWHIVKSVLGI